MEILDFGDFVQNGKYRLHSKFDKVHNYQNDGDIISFVSTKIGQGPNNIILNEIPDYAENYVLISDKYLSIGNAELRISTRESWFEKDIFLKELSAVQIEIDKLINLAEDLISPKSLGFLLFPKNEVYFQSLYDRALLKHVNEAVRDIQLKKLPEIAQKMKGVGFGLTPSGDDFNCGMLYALHYVNSLKEIDLSGLIKECYTKSLGKNMISNTLLKYAYLNQYYENFYKLLLAMKKEENYNISRSLKAVIDSGHSSGSDMITGFLLTMNLLYKPVRMGN